MPTRRRRHSITETPPVQAALDELRAELGSDRVEMGELVVLGAHVKLAAVRGERQEQAKLRKRLADRVRRRDLPVSREAADEVRGEPRRGVLAVPARGRLLRAQIRRSR